MTGPVQRLYDAFRAKDGMAMQECYAPDATFRDPVFMLDGQREVGGMWRMLVEQGTDLQLEVSGIEEDGTTGKAHWVATYTFGPTGRQVVNEIDATFGLQDGRIVRHVDDFDLWKWTRMALGPMGTVLGWSPIVQGKVRSQARRSLDKWLEKNP